MKTILGGLAGILLGSLCGLLFAGVLATGSAFSFSPSHVKPVLHQIFLPLLGAGGGSAALPTITFVTQTVANASGATCSSWTFSVPAPANGDTLILNWSVNPNSRSVGGVTLTGTSGWARAIHNSDASLGTGNDEWFGAVGAGAGTSITITPTGAVTTCWANVAEFSGIAASPLDGSGVGNVAVNTTSTTGAYSTGTANDLVMAPVCLANPANITGFPSGYTQLTLPSGSPPCEVSYQVVSGSGAQSATWNLNASLRAYNTIIGFKP